MVGSTQNSASYAGNGSTSTAYSIPFRYDAPGWVEVTLQSPAGVIVDLVQGVDYTLAGSGSLTTGTLTTTLAYASGYTLTIWREAPGIQALDLTPNTPLPAVALEGALDRAAMAAEDSTKPRHFWSLSALVASIKATLDALNPLHWESILDKPATFAPSAHDHAWDSILDKPTTFEPSAHTQGWDTITSKPTVFTPDSHTHAQSEIIGWGSTSLTISTLATYSYGSLPGIVASANSAEGLIATSRTNAYCARFNNDLVTPATQFAIARNRGWLVWFYSTFIGTLKTQDITANRNWTLPDKTGVIGALDSYADSTAANAVVDVGDAWWDSTLKKVRTRL